MWCADASHDPRFLRGTGITIRGRYTGGTGYFDGAPAIWSPDGKTIATETAPVNFELITTTDLKHVVIKSLPPGLPTWTRTTVVRFKVSQNRNWVTGMYVGPYPVTRCGGGGGVPIQSTARAAVTNGSFTAHVTYRSDSGKLLAKATVKGTFGRHGGEQGTVHTTIVGEANCGAVYRYETTAQ